MLKGNTSHHTCFTTLGLRPRVLWVHILSTQTILTYCTPDVTLSQEMLPPTKLVFGESTSSHQSFGMGWESQVHGSKTAILKNIHMRQVITLLGIRRFHEPTNLTDEREKMADRSITTKKIDWCDRFNLSAVQCSLSSY